MGLFIRWRITTEIQFEGERNSHPGHFSSDFHVVHIGPILLAWRKFKQRWPSRLNVRILKADQAASSMTWQRGNSHARSSDIFVALGLAGLLSDNVEQAAAADDISRRNNLHVTRPNAPHHPDDSFSRMFPGLPPYTPQTDKAREQAKKLVVKGGILDAASPFWGQFFDHDFTLALKAHRYLNKPT